MMFRTFAAAAAAVALAPLTAIAQQDPVINPSLVLRGLNSSSNTEGNNPGADDQYEDSTEAPGSYIRSGTSSAFGDKGSTASGDVEIRSEISDFKISAEGSGHAESNYSDPEGDASSASVVYFQMLFTVPVDTTFSVYGRYKLTNTNTPPELSFANSFEFSIQGADPDFNAFHISESVTGTTGPDHEYFFYTQRVKANTQIVMQCTAQTVAARLTPGSASGDFDYFFTIDFGDSDEDGLIDDWENAGIDIDNDGTPEIDLPDMGADPDKKNLFVELDSQAGVNVSQTAISMVEQAFAQAPASAVDNPDGSAGILLFFLVDDSDLPNAVFGVASGFATGFDAQKATRYGTSELRNHPEWDTIKKAYRKIFRYCIWGQDIQDSDGSFSGISELPGNDFFVAGGVIPTWYADPTLATNALAGTLMHEFGHCLGLRHGGNENVNYKPNYLSVMNYAYQLPFTQTTIDGTQISDVWFLDYARTSPNSLDESALEEDEGFNGPAGRKMIFNIMPDGFEPQLEIVNADAAEIDWDLTASIETEPVAVDLNRFEGTTDALSSLSAVADWNRIEYAIGDGGDYADGSHTSSGSIERFNFADFQRISSYTAHDRSAGVCKADVNADGVLDLGDIQAFVDLFLASDLAADFNPDGVLDTGDITAFVVAFLEGC